MNVRGIFTAKRADGTVSWTVVAGWLVVLAGALDIILKQELVPASWVPYLVAAIGIVKLVLRAKTGVPLDSNETALRRAVGSPTTRRREHL